MKDRDEPRGPYHAVHDYWYAWKLYRDAFFVASMSEDNAKQIAADMNALHTHNLTPARLELVMKVVAEAEGLKKVLIRIDEGKAMKAELLMAAIPVVVALDAAGSEGE